MEWVARSVVSGTVYTAQGMFWVAIPVNRTHGLYTLCCELRAHFPYYIRDTLVVSHRGYDLATHLKQVGAGTRCRVRLWLRSSLVPCITCNLQRSLAAVFDRILWLRSGFRSNAICTVAEYMHVQIHAASICSTHKLENPVISDRSA